MLARQVPNLVTGARLVLAVGAFVFMARVLESEPGSAAIEREAFWAFWFFFIASITDFIDGYLARKYNWVTALGRVADPVVDKVLTLGAMIYLAVDDSLYAIDGDLYSVMPVWVVVLMIGREFLVTALRGLVESQGLQFGADWFGKIKLILQTYYISVALGVMGGIPDFLFMPWLDFTRHPVLFAVTFWAMVILTIFSGMNYCVKGVRLMSNHKS
ncbi:MAG: CDP-diacylglycerol--glycerol-3-phosphate 3-phosphatidyltransferase [Planctomycetes bacterium]|nr:CDP-diacylglycerol--glycerol-3-phosphate 3-phosphatidyltransferase [Planctomycetota bacterium]MCP4769963.1 CDP-diacylglycerol--glycerol-3-phosphate 3-phosphatidyltransferase [Planctomycetota bacterium]MCP4859803.1 CDP-diacylglycerol--glycerol-3-phosphate 3-phosphatidyltransferase [Planctomycetota bacterium]